MNLGSHVAVSWGFFLEQLYSLVARNYHEVCGDTIVVLQSWKFRIGFVLCVIIMTLLPLFTDTFCSSGAILPLWTKLQH